MNNEKKGNITKIHQMVINEIKLPEVINSMAQLQVENSTSVETAENNSSSSSESTSANRRVLRKRKPKCSDSEIKEILNYSILNRRVNQKPRKRTYKEMQSEDEIKDYYLDKRIKKMPNSLETIFEEDNSTNENAARIGKKKFKRLILFGEASLSKIKKRHAKMKLLGKSFSGKKSKITMESVIKKLNSSHTEVVVNESLIINNECTSDNVRQDKSKDKRL